MSLTARILSRTGHPVQHLVLEVPPAFTFRAGQYLEVLHPRGSIPLSIASAPHRLPELHLHYRSAPGAPEATWMDELLDTGDTLTVRGPGGNVSLPAAARGPVLLVAGGTGIAQALGLIDDHQAARGDPGMTLLWCADSQGDFYLREELAIYRDWLQVVCIADADRTPANEALAWLRAYGQRFAGADCAVVIAGSPGFAYAATDTLLETGVGAAQIQSDVFSYAPRT